MKTKKPIDTILIVTITLSFAIVVLLSVVWLLDQIGLISLGIKSAKTIDSTRHPSPSKSISDTTSQIGSYELVFSTYLGGSQYEHARDVFVDDQGFIYIVGGTSSANFPHTTGPAYNNNSCSSAGSGGGMDAAIAKFSTNGQLVWSRLLGGPCYDRAYAVEVDQDGYVYVSGRAGEGFPTTTGSFQSNFNGSSVSTSPLYGAQNGFMAKISPNGTNVLWASYVGVTELVRDFDMDSQGDLYLVAGNPNIGKTPPSTWFTNAFQNTPQGGLDSGVMKVSNNGSQVLWATWLGSPGKESIEGSIRLDNQGYVLVSGCTYSAGFPTDPKSAVNPEVYDRTYNGAADGFVAKLNPDGSDLVYATYIGGSADDFLCSTHNLAVDDQGNAYIVTQTNSSDFPATSGAFTALADNAVVKFSPAGALIASTIIGGSGQENPDGIYVDSQGNVFFTGQSDSTNYPTVNPLLVEEINFNGSYQHGQFDATLSILSADFEQLLFSTYLGGPAKDLGRSSYLGKDGNLYVVGSSEGGSGWPLMNEYQNYSGSVDMILAKLIPQNILPPTSTPATLITETSSSSPTQLPTNTFTSIPTNTFVPTHTPAPTSTATLPPSATPLPTNTFTVVPTNTSLPTHTPVPTSTATQPPSVTPLPTNTFTVVPTKTSLPTQTPAPTSTATQHPSTTPLPTNTFTVVPTDKSLSTNTPVPSNTATQIPSTTSLPINTFTPVPTKTSIPTSTPTKIPSATPLPSYTFTPLPTNTPKPTYTSVPTSTPTQLPSSTPLPTRTFTLTPTTTPLPTNTTTATITPTTTATPEPTFVPLPAPDPISEVVFKGEYFDNKQLKGSPVLIRYDRGIDFDWSRKAPDPSVPKNFFSVRWTRDKYFSAGDYQFTFWSDDGLRIYIDDKVIYDEWKNKRAEVDYLNLSISEGYHLIKVEYYENKGYAEVGVIWEKK